VAPLALVYRGRATVPGCPEAVARLLRTSDVPLRVAYVGEHEEYPLTPEVLAGTTVYAQPGGGELGPAWRRMRGHAAAIRTFVRSGGRFVGFCLGGYLAGHSPGFGLLDGDAHQYVRSAGAETVSERPAILEVTWAQRPRRIYFQDGCAFAVGPHTEVIARYRNGEPAAVVNPFGAGRVAAVGPHPEATDDWFLDEGLEPVRPLTHDLGLDLLRRLMA